MTMGKNTAEDFVSKEAMLHSSQKVWNRWVPVKIHSRLTKKHLLLSSLLLSFLFFWFIAARTNNPAHSSIQSITVPEPQIDKTIAVDREADILQFERRLLAIKKWAEDYSLMDRPFVEIHKAVKADTIPCPKTIKLHLDVLAQHRRVGAEETNRKRYHSIIYAQTTFRTMLNQLPILRTKKFPREQRPLHCEKCFKFQFKTSIEPKTCDSKSDAKVVAVVTTLPSHRTERDRVRKTWASHPDLIHIFLLGKVHDPTELGDLQKENQEYGDILLEEYQENYYNLTYKVLSGFRWVQLRCKQVGFIIRAADDTYVNVPLLLKLIFDHGDSSYLREYQIGSCLIGDRYSPYRMIDNKGYISTYEYNASTFPPYALGTVYLLSKKLMERIVMEAPNVPFFSIEDTYFGFVLKKIDSGCFALRRWSYNTYEDLPLPNSKTVDHFTYHMFAGKDLDAVDGLLKGKSYGEKIGLEGKLYVNEK